ncbi:MAG: bifunctional enoyl-CoA hydratase/phosphate acetyltransferase [Candidatus Eremiobacteraeota bacterium]|nr:bifunctional enoyl-CoA hydratase/phosphate acetyltransferase [Candidatus Eremiobacteraeota bacterium]
MFNDYDEIVAMAKKYAPMKVAVAGAEEDTVLAAVKEAEEAGLVECTLIGNRDAILPLARSAGYKVREDRLVHVEDREKAAPEAVKRASSGEVDIVLKGNVQTASLMKAVLDKDTGLRTRKLVSHIFFIKLPGYHKFLSLTDGGINIAPTLEEKQAILENCIGFYHLMGLEKPKIALLAPVETVSDKIPCTVDAAILSKMADRGQLKGALIDGPLAFDLAISSESVREKGIESKVAGDADVLFVSGIDMGNGLFKGLVHFGKGIPAAVMLGTKKPVIVTSRADSAECKFYSIALNVLYAGKLGEKK